MPKIIYKRRSLCKEMLILFSVLFLPGIIAQTGTMASPSFGNPLYLLQVLVVSIPQILLIVYVLELQPDSDWAAFGIRRPRLRDVGQATLFYLALLGAFLPLGAAATLLPEDTLRELMPGTAWSFSRLEMLPAVAVAMLAVGYREELFFRSYMITRLEQFGLGGFRAVALSTLLFSVGHAYQGVAGLIVSFVIGALFGALYLRTRNLHALAGAHALYNLTVLVVRTGAPVT